MSEGRKGSVGLRSFCGLVKYTTPASLAQWSSPYILQFVEIQNAELTKKQNGRRLLEKRRGKKQQGGTEDMRQRKGLKGGTVVDSEHLRQDGRQRGRQRN